jgi:lipid A 3-O-deacylase
MRLVFFATLISLAFQTYAQTNRAVSYNQLRFVRLSSQNDLYQRKNQSDKYFSVGTTIELRHPAFNNVVSRTVLAGLKNVRSNEYGVAVNQQGFTPTNIALPELNPLDRPYAGLLYADFYRISSNTERGLRIRTSLKVGVLGSASGMAQTQKFVHRLTGDAQPIGWEKQIGNTVLLDYTFKITQELPLDLSFLRISVSAESEIGTVFNLLGVGTKIKLGIINNLDLYSNRESTPKNTVRRVQTKHKLQLYTFVEPRVNYVIYDGTILGGLLPFQESPNKLRRSTVESTLVYVSYGLASRYKNFVFSYKRILRTDRFNEWDQFSWGEVEMVFLF